MRLLDPLPLLLLLPFTHALSSPAFSPSPTSLSYPLDHGFIREPGRCAMRDSCGRKSTFGGDIPCPDNGLALAHDSDDDLMYRATLAQVCGEDFETTTCCTLGQLETLQSSLAQAEPLIASCPACRLSFRRFYCHFTCSPSQSLFLTVASTQTLQKDGHPSEAVKEVEFSVSKEFGQGFFDSCKDVKFGATNGYAMDLLGGGAKDYLTFLRYMGTERSLGSPFTISFPPPLSSPPSASSSLSLSLPSPPTPFTLPPLSCASSLPSERCACPDCPAVCAALPPVLSPREREQKRCKVGKMDCFPFGLVIVYAVALGVATAWAAAREARTRWTGREGGIRLGEEDGGSEGGGGEDEEAVGLGTWRRLKHRLSFGGWSSRRGSGAGSEVDASAPSPNLRDRDDESRSRSRSGTGGTGSSRGGGLVGARSLASELDGADSSPSSRSRDLPSSSHHSQRLSSHSATSSHDPFSLTSSFDPSLQPRTYPLNTLLSHFFYRLGLWCARRPWLTLALGLALSGVANLGWKRFEVERDPVKLWVPKGSEVARQKERFEEAFGPFYRTEQVFFSVAPPSGKKSLGDDDGEGQVEETGWNPLDEPVLSYSALKFISSIDADIRALVSSPSNLTLSDVCFAPTSSSSSPPADGDSSLCIVQSPLGYFPPDLKGVTEENWAQTLDGCAESPASCLPPFGQPINPKLVLSSPASSPDNDDNDDEKSPPHRARAVILTYVLSSSLSPTLTALSEEWESSLSSYLRTLSSPSHPASLTHNLKISYTTGLSLEEELNAATNTDVKVVVLSYLVMFAYVALALGGSVGGAGRLVVRGVGGACGAVGRGLRGVSRRWAGKKEGAVRLGEGERRAAVASNGGGGGAAVGAYLRRKLLVDSKFLLGLVGILIVLLSVSTSVAICSAAGIKVTLVIAEVIPFLVLAIGVDNVFLLVHTLSTINAAAYASSTRHLTSSGGGLPSGDGLLNNEDDDDDFSDDDLPSAEERVARALSCMGPSILLSASCETVAFALGALVGMPAVRNFAIYAAGAVLVNSGMQVTLFVAAMALDLRRTEAGRIDCFPCLKLPPSSSSPSASSASLTARLHAPRESLLSRFVRTVYAPTLLRKPVKYLVLALFSGLFVLSWIWSRHIELGLDQRLALPTDSYLVDYFNAVDTYLDVGPPVYFVVDSTRGINATALEGVKELCGRFSTCDEYSVANVLEAERKRPESSYLAEPPAVWIDDFISWTNPLLEDCCRVKRRNPNEFCGPNDSEYACKPCFEGREPEWSTTLDGYPQGPEFMRYVRQWLDSPTDESCPLGGKASYSSALKLSDLNSTSPSSSTDVVVDSVELSHFRTYHTPLKTQSDFIEALAAAQRVSKDLSRRIGAEVFPYSLPYVFFQSYATLWSTTREVLTFALLAVFLVTSLLLGSLRTALVVTLTTYLSLFTVIGAMGALSISLNPLSLTNLCVSVGIAVEFNAHLARAFVGANGGGLPYHHPGAARDRDERAKAALEDLGASVISGIGATKLIGVGVLFFTKSALLRTYYARMWLALVLASALHGLVFLPVALSFFGGRGYNLHTEDGDTIASTIQRRYGETPFRDDDASASEGSDDL